MFDERKAEPMADPCSAPEYLRFREELRSRGKHELAGRRRRRVLRRVMASASAGVAAMLVITLSWSTGSVQAPALSPAHVKEVEALPEKPRNKDAREDAAPEVSDWSFHSRPLPAYLRGEVPVSTAAPKEVDHALIVCTRPLPESIAIGSRTVRGFVVH